MLLDAYKAEVYRLFKNRVTVFWALYFVPLIIVVGGSLVAWYLVEQGKKIAEQLPGVPVTASNLAMPLMEVVSRSANIATLGFLVIGVAILFAGDYRWETWRLISARNTRFNLMAGKMMTLLMLAVMASLGLILAVILVVLFASLLEGHGLSFRTGDHYWLQLGSLYLLSLARLLQILLLVALAATFTRSILGAVFFPVAVGIGQTLLVAPLSLFGIAPTDWQAILLSPGLAFDHLKEAARGLSYASEAATQVQTYSLVSISLWIILPLILTFLLFQRQPLAKE